MLEYLNTNMDNIFKANENIFGGTEFIQKYFKDEIVNLLPKLKNYNCLMFPGHREKLLIEYSFDKKQMILWLHNLPYNINGNFYELLNNDFFINNIKYVIVVSEYAKHKTLQNTKLKEEQIVVIYNFIDPVYNNFLKFKDVKKINIIHTSSYDRGFEVFANSLKYIDLDFRLEVYNEINPDVNYVSDEYKKIYKDKRLFFYGKTPKKTVIDAVSRSHIMAYPAIIEETFCLSQVEALSANCLTVFNDIGALKEVSLGFGNSYKIEFDIIEIEKHAKVFAKELESAINKIKNKEFNPKNQKKIIDNKFSKENFKNSWINLHKKI
jgi:glycosyltransferase involved in cell wall biosynthesis